METQVNIFQTKNYFEKWYVAAAACHSFTNKIVNFSRSSLWTGYPLLLNLDPSASLLAKSSNKSMSHSRLTISHPEPGTFEFWISLSTASHFRTFAFFLYSQANKQTNVSFCQGSMNMHLICFEHWRKQITSILLLCLHFIHVSWMSPCLG